MVHLPHVPPIVAEHAAAAVACSSQDGIPPRAILIADMSASNRAPRLWAFDLSDPKHPQLVLRSQVEHGFGSDPGRTGYATRFSDVEGSSMSSLGLYRIADSYFGVHGPSYRLQGLSASNAHAWDRDVMLHPTDTITAQSVGYSAGCASVAPSTLSSLTRHFGTLTGALLWMDGPGVKVPSCAATRPLQWTPPAGSVWTSVAKAGPACTAA